MIFIVNGFRDLYLVDCKKSEFKKEYTLNIKKMD